jgi:hypothetical protein
VPPKYYFECQWCRILAEGYQDPNLDSADCYPNDWSMIVTGRRQIDWACGQCVSLRLKEQGSAYEQHTREANVLLERS